MNKRQRKEYNETLISFNRAWVVITTMLAIMASWGIVFNFSEATTVVTQVIVTGIIYCLLWVLIYLSGIVIMQNHTHRRVLKET